MAKIPTLLPTDGNREGGEIEEFTHVPDEGDAGKGVKVDPATGSWVRLTAIAGSGDFGYVTARTPTGTRATKVRFVLTDHPDGPA